MTDIASKELKKALTKDFNTLLVRQFTTDWRTQRIIRELEISVMSLGNLQALIAEQCIEATHQATAYTTLHMEEWHLNRLIDISNGFKTVQELKDESYKRQEALKGLVQLTKDKEG